MPERLVLFAHARSGSTTLATALALHPGLTIDLEPFNPRRGNKGRPVYAERVHSIRDLDAALDSIFADHNSIKHLSGHLPSQWNRHLIDSADCLVILHRRNLLAAAVSDAMAGQSGNWQPRARERQRHHEFGALSVDQVRRGVEHFREIRDVYLPHARASGQDFLEIEFEGLFGSTVPIATRLARFERLLAFVGLSPDSGVTSAAMALLGQQPLNHHESYLLVPNIAEIESTLSGPDGSLFTEFDARSDGVEPRGPT
jgi:hypothetical protein